MTCYVLTNRIVNYKHGMMTLESERAFVTLEMDLFAISHLAEELFNMATCKHERSLTEERIEYSIRAVMCSVNWYMDEH